LNTFSEKESLKKDWKDKNRVYIHCSAGLGRTGHNIMMMKKIISPIDGIDFK